MSVAVRGSDTMDATIIKRGHAGVFYKPQGTYLSFKAFRPLCDITLFSDSITWTGPEKGNIPLESRTKVYKVDIVGWEELHISDPRYDPPMVLILTSLGTSRSKWLEAIELTITRIRNSRSSRQSAPISIVNDNRQFNVEDHHHLPGPTGGDRQLGGASASGHRNVLADPASHEDRATRERSRSPRDFKNQKITENQKIKQFFDKDNSAGKGFTNAVLIKAAKHFHEGERALPKSNNTRDVIVQLIADIPDMTLKKLTEFLST